MTGTTQGFEAVVFDLDGVLVDTEPWWDDIRLEFATRHGRPWTDADREAVMGANSRQWSATMRERLRLDLAPEQIERQVVDGVLRRYATEHPPRIDGAADAVRRIGATRPIAIASSAHREIIEAALLALDLDGHFGAVVSSDEVAHGKPAPDVYLEAARRLGVDPARCLVVEDSRNGVLAARAAGMTVVLVPSALIPPAPGTEALADVVLHRLADLDPDALTKTAGAP
jgi:HAD superfamily hydrolase (TIGR01509 family)